MIHTRQVQHTPEAKRDKLFWVEIDTGDLAVQEHEDQRTDLFFSQHLGNKFHCLCKLHSIFLDCPARTRSCNFPNGSKTIEQTGEHDHAYETFSYGLPQRHKDEIVSLLTQYDKFKPTFARVTIEKNITSLCQKKASGFMARQRALLREACQEKTVSGVKNFLV